MNTAHDRILSAGCAAFLIAFLAAILLTLFGGWRHSIWIGVTLGGGLLLGRYSGRRLRQRIQTFIDSAFTSRGVEAPTFKYARGYGYPGYELAFTSKEAEEIALSSGALPDFKNRIQEFHRNDGSKSRPFDAGMAVHTTYPGKLYF